MEKLKQNQKNRLAFGEEILKNLDYFSDCLKAEEKTVKKTSRQLSEDLELYRLFFNLLFETVNHINELAKHRKHSTAKTVVSFITPRILQTMQSIRVLNLKGYYYDVTVLERSLIESMGLCAYFALNEEEAKGWMKDKKIKIAKIRLVDYISKLLGGEDESGKSFYGQLSRYVHADLKAIATLLIGIKDEDSGATFELVPYSKKRMCEKSPIIQCLCCLFCRRYIEMNLQKKEEKKYGDY